MQSQRSFKKKQSHAHNNVINGQPQGGAGSDRDDGDASSPRRGAVATTAQVPTTGQTTGQTARTIRTGTADDLDRRLDRLCGQYGQGLLTIWTDDWTDCADNTDRDC